MKKNELEVFTLKIKWAMRGWVRKRGRGTFSRNARNGKGDPPIGDTYNKYGDAETRIEIESLGKHGTFGRERDRDRERDRQTDRERGILRKFKKVGANRWGIPLHHKERPFRFDL